MSDEEPKGGGKSESLMIGCAGCLVAVAIAIGLFFGVCSMMRR